MMTSLESFVPLILAVALFWIGAKAFLGGLFGGFFNGLFSWFFQTKVLIVMVPLLLIFGPALLPLLPDLMVSVMVGIFHVVETAFKAVAGGLLSS